MPREEIPTRTLGIDLASQAKETGVCLIEWAEGAGKVLDLGQESLTDDVLVELMRDPRVSKVGIDAPFGWPMAFIDAITSYRDSGTWLDLDANEMRFRATETRIFEETRQWPLTVAMSDLAWPAMRCAPLLTRVTPPGRELDRSGRSGVPVEVYPMVALRRWEVIPPGSAPSTWSYKGDKPGRRDRREQYLAVLQDRLGGQVTMSAAHREAFVDDDDDFDAFVSALVARAAQLGMTDAIPRGMAWLAMREGWIHVPETGSLASLATV